MAEEVIQSLHQTLIELRDGKLIIEGSQELTRLIEAVRTTGKKGKLVVTLTMRKVSKGDSPAISIEDDLKVIIPTPDRSASLFYATSENLLVSSDPRQTKLFQEETGRPKLVEFREKEEAQDLKGAAANDR